MDDNLRLLIGPCPNCGNGRLDAVFDGELTNFLCSRCGHCWHPELEWVQRVDPQSCPGCASRKVCLATDRPYGDKLAERD